MGSRSNNDIAYIAGFLDGDGSLMLQLKKRSDSKRQWRFMCTICFYQDSRHKTPLSWIRNVLGIGYLSDRNDGMSELRINGFLQVREIMRQLVPYIRFKKVQAQALLKAAELLSRKTARQLSRQELRKLVALMVIIQSDNYATKSKKTREELLRMLGLTP